MTAQTKQEELEKKVLDIIEHKTLEEHAATQLIVELINSEVLSVLEELEKSSAHYTPDGLVADALDPWATSVKMLQSIKNRYKL